MEYLKSELFLDKIIKFYDEDDISLELLFNGELEVIKKDLDTLKILKKFLTCRSVDTGCGETLVLSAGIVKDSPEGKLIEEFLKKD